MIEIISLVAIELDKRLTRLEEETCGARTTLVDKPWSIPVVCNRIRGHAEVEHSDGMSKWRTQGKHFDVV